LVLQKSSSAGLGATLAVDFLSLHLVDNISIIPTQLLACGNVALSKKPYPRKSQIVGVHKTVLDENVRSARMIEVPANVANDLGIHDVDVFVLPEELASRGVLWFFNFRFVNDCGTGHFGRFLFLFISASRLPVTGLRRNGNVLGVKRSVRFLVRCC
jgi:hypothetical protein